MALKFDQNGVPILGLDDKIEALRACIKEGANEDAVGHLFDLLNHVAPGYCLGNCNGIVRLHNYYGCAPTPITR